MENNLVKLGLPPNETPENILKEETSSEEVERKKAEEVQENKEAEDLFQTTKQTVEFITGGVHNDIISYLDKSKKLETIRDSFNFLQIKEKKKIRGEIDNSQDKLKKLKEIEKEANEVVSKVSRFPLLWKSKNYRDLASFLLEVKEALERDDFKPYLLGGKEGFVDNIKKSLR